MSVKIPLSNGMSAIIDASDVTLVEGFKWAARKGKAGYYAVRFKKVGYIPMHKVIMQPLSGFVVDHINGNTLDNRRSNLRCCTNKENVRNMRKHKGKSRYKGVYWAAHAKKWAAHISPNGKTLHLGYSHSEEEAALMYDVAAQLFYGSFAKLNHV